MKPSFTTTLAGITLLFSAISANAIETAPYFVVADDTIAAHLIDEHEQALKAFKQKVDRSGYKQSWRFYHFDDGRHVAFNAQTSHDYESTSGQHWQDVQAHFDEAFLAKNSEVYRKTISHQDYYLMRYVSQLSFEPQEKNDAPLDHIVYVEIQLHRHLVGSIRPALKQWIEKQKANKDAFHFSTYSKQYGANMPTLYLAFHATSFVDFYQRLSRQGVFDPVQLFPDEIKQAIKQYDISLGKYVPEISY